MNFKDLELKEPILSAVNKAKYETPSPIQEKAIPVMLEGKDIVACAQTGTGKTAAFALPILNTKSEKLIAPTNKPKKGLIIYLTKELTIAVKAPPMITPTAKSITLPRDMNSLNSFNIK